MNELEGLYRDLILDHFRNPRNAGRLAGANVEADGVNPLCGDKIHLSLQVQDGHVKAIRLEGQGCSISQASGSIMTEALKGKTLDACQELVKSFKHLMLENGSSDALPEDLEEAAALEGVKKYPVRIKCALLSWNTLVEALASYTEKNKPST